MAAEIAASIELRRNAADFPDVVYEARFERIGVVPREGFELATRSRLQAIETSR